MAKLIIEETDNGYIFTLDKGGFYIPRIIKKVTQSLQEMLQMVADSMGGEGDPIVTVSWENPE